MQTRSGDFKHFVHLQSPGLFRASVLKGSNQGPAASETLAAAVECSPSASRLHPWKTGPLRLNFSLQPSKHELFRYPSKRATLKCQASKTPLLCGTHVWVKKYIPKFSLEGRWITMHYGVGRSVHDGTEGTESQMRLGKSGLW